MQAALSAYLNPRRPILSRFSQEIGASSTNRFPSWSGVRPARAIRRFSIPETNEQRSTRWLDPLTNESHTASGVYDTVRMMTRESTHRKEVSLSLSLSLPLSPSLLLFSFSRLPRQSCKELPQNPNQTQIERKREEDRRNSHSRVHHWSRDDTWTANCRRGSAGNVLPLCPDSWRVVCLDCPPAPGT